MVVTTGTPPGSDQVPALHAAFEGVCADPVGNHEVGVRCGQLWGMPGDE